MMEINCHSFLLYPAKVLRKIGIIMEDKEKTPSIPYPARHIPSFGGAWGGRLFGSSFCQIISLLFFNLRPFAL
jgi:hypothetical protein